MANQARLHSEFENICIQLLRRLHFDVCRQMLMEGLGLPPYQIEARDSKQTYLVEVKWSAYKSIDLERLRDWSAKTAALSAAYIPLLIVSGKVEQTRKQWAEQEYKIEIWDREFLLKQGRAVGLHKELNDFFQASDKAGKVQRPRKSQSQDEREQTEELERSVSAPAAEELITLLENIKTGKGDATKYERCCQTIIEYLFGQHLLDPRPQQRLEDGLSYLDIVYRVSPLHPFWETLTRDFRARVVVFECKNYSEALGPLQVYTTERYMSVGALRPICFVLSRRPVHAHAELAAFGAMRESGKLLIFLSDEDLKTMLRLRAAQLREEPSRRDSNDPTIYLDQKIYDFIARLPR